ncbi:MAG TPA: tetratricopeptide repeat protein [Candidatus Acidoferrum sp.]|nr:tetratricopeptide repeat protein [Candidatus Acidoferrum sp.]
MKPPMHPRYSFGPFLLDPVEKVLLRDEHALHLPPKAFETLLALVENEGHVLEKADLLNRVWPNTFVEEATLAQNIFTLRKALGVGTNGHEYIETVPKHGYRFVAVVAAELAAPVKPTKVMCQSQSARPLGFLTLAIAAVVLVFVVMWLNWGRIRSRENSSTSKIMVAVIPLENLSGDPGQDYFCDGLTEELVTKFGSLSPDRLGVIARITSMQYKNTQKNATQIGSELGVKYILEGSVVRENERVRINAQLIRVRDQTHVWAHSYERDLRGVLTLQNDVATAIANAVEVKLETPAQPSGMVHGTQNSAAYEAYLQGRYFWNRRTEEGYQKALPYFQDAIREDPNYAQAYAGLADTYALLGSLSNSVLPRSEAMPEARRAALRALELDETLAEAHTSLAFVKMQYDREWEIAEHEYKCAIELNPGYATAHHWYAYLLMSEGRSADALKEIHLARESDPLSMVINSDVGEMYYYAHQFDRAIEQYRKVLQMDSHFLPAYWQIATVYVQMRRYSDAIAALQQAESLGGRRPETTAWMGYVYAVSGQHQEAEKRLKELQELSKQNPDLTESISLIYAGLGQTDHMFTSIDKSCKEHTGSVILLKVNPLLDSLHGDPRYIKAVQCLGLR